MRPLAAAALAGLALACGHRPQLRPPPPLGGEPARPPPAADGAPAPVPGRGAGDGARAAADARAPLPPEPTEPHVEPDLLGAVHVVKKGETLYRIARTYGIAPRDLMEVNDLSDPRQLRPGTELFVPGARRALDVPSLAPGGPVEPEPEEPPEPAPRPPPPRPGAAPAARAADGRTPLRWPVRGVLYSRFGMRQGQRHDGIDIAAPEGAAVSAAADGTVVYAGRQAGYGQIVILRHAGGLLTLYAHNAKVLVPEGAHVKGGEPIARVGQSGKTTGPHLHFEVRQGTRPRNPLLYLR